MFRERDIFGYTIGVTYKGSDKYNTYLGSSCTITSYVMILFNLLVLITAFRTKSKQEEKTQLTLIDRFTDEEQYKLTDYNTELALFTSKPLPTNIGRYRAIQSKGCVSGIA